MKNRWIGILAFAALPAAISLGANEYEITSILVPSGALGVSASAINKQHDVAINAWCQGPIDVPTGSPTSYSLPYIWSGGVMSALPMGDTYVSGKVLDVNNSGAAVGFVTDASGSNFPAIWSGGALTVLATGSMPEGAAWSINNQGQIAGFTATHNGPNYSSLASVWDGTSLVILGAYGKDPAMAVAVNDTGQVLVVANGAMGASVFVHQGPSDLALDRPISGATTLNNLGQILCVGSDDVNYLWQAGAIKTLATAPGSEIAVPWAMNDTGDVVGYASSHDGMLKAILWRDDQALDLSTLVGDGWDFTAATGITDDGAIIATGTYQGQRKTVLLTSSPSPASSATPEPATAATLLLAAPLLLRRRRRSV